MSPEQSKSTGDVDENDKMYIARLYVYLHDIGGRAPFVVQDDLDLMEMPVGSSRTDRQPECASARSMKLMHKTIDLQKTVEALASRSLSNRSAIRDESARHRD